MIFKKGLTFDDLLLMPRYSLVLPNEVDVSTQLTPKIKLKIPIISIHMDTVTEWRMAAAMAQAGAIGIIHRNCSVEYEIEQVKKVKKIKGKSRQATVDEKGFLQTIAAIGAGNEAIERGKALIKNSVDVLAIDASHGDSKNVIETILVLKKQFPKQEIIGGNVATAEGIRHLAQTKVEAVKVGVGNGTICTTRVVSGVGMPQMTALFNTVSAGKKYKAGIIADGGIKYSGEIVKALATGAVAVCLGSLLAGCKEAPGKLIEVNGKKYKQYRAMGSTSAMLEGRTGNRYNYKRGSVNKISQGIEGAVPYKGPLIKVLNQLVGGLQSGMAFVGAGNLSELAPKAKFLQITPASLAESHPHGVVMLKEEPNYKGKVK